QTWKTQYHVRNIMDRLYTNAPDGLCGDEDNGQTSAWYVFSALGFYPVCPGSNQYVIGTPLFKKASVHFSNGNILHIDAPQNSKENMYIQSLRFNHQIQEANYFTHQDLIKGGNITFDLTSTPNYNRGIEAKFFPFSITNSK
ncbi:MAG: glycoside hydrolase domain-containing protein, partial [Ferruginibacter sp.]